MKYFLIVIAIFFVFFVHRRITQKIDKEEAEALRTPGTATFIRTHFPNLVETLVTEYHLSIEFERNDCIRLINPQGDMLLLQQFSGKLKVAYFHESTLVQEWDFETNEQIRKIVNQVSNYI